MKEKKEPSFMTHIPQEEIKYLLSLDESSSPYITSEGICQSEEDCQKDCTYVNWLWNLQYIVEIYDKAIDLLNEIDMECYPEVYDLQEKVCQSLVETYYKEKDLYYDDLGHLDIYNPCIEGMSSRNGMISID